MSRPPLPSTIELNDRSISHSRVTFNASDLPVPPPNQLFQRDPHSPHDLPASGPLRIRTLRVSGGRDMMRFVTLFPGEEIIIGREETSTLVLGDASVSRRHVRVQCTADGQMMVQDLKSLNGTAITEDLLIKGVPIESAVLKPGSWLEVGGVVVHLEMLSLEQLGHLERMVARLDDAKRDAGTGLLPPSWLETDLSLLMQRHASMQLPLSCIMAEPDTGDAVRNRAGETGLRDMLAGISRLLMWKVRQFDLCIQESPKMTMIFLPGVGLSIAAAVAERLRREVASYRWPRPLAGTRVTISTGIAQWNGEESAGEWIGRAHTMLEARRRQVRG